MTTYHSNLDDFLTVKEYCGLTNKKQITVYKMIQRGKLPSKKVGGKIFINSKYLPSLDEEK